MWTCWTIYPEAESGPALTVNFMPSWWYREYGISHGERLFTDVDHRAEIQREMNRLLYDRFGHLGLGDPDPHLTYSIGDLGNATMPAALGCEVMYSDDGYPVNLSLSEEKLRDLVDAPSDITQCFPMREMIRQSEHIRLKTDQSPAVSWPCMGVQNIAVLTRGADLLAEYYIDPESAHRLLDVSYELISRSLDYFKSIGTQMDPVSNQNCTVALLRPQLYSDQLYDYESRLFCAARKLGWNYHIHHCGNFDDYALLYRRLPSVAGLQIGWGSDLRMALDTFPEAEVDYLISPTFIQCSDTSAIRECMRSLVETAGVDIGRVSFSLTDVEHGTPDENIMTVAEELRNSRLRGELVREEV